MVSGPVRVASGSHRPDRTGHWPDMSGLSGLHLPNPIAMTRQTNAACTKQRLIRRGQHQSEGFAPDFTASRRPMNGSGGASSSPRTVGGLSGLLEGLPLW